MNNTSLSKKESLRCERCDAEDAVSIGGHVICPECSHLLGSCCLEFGGDDLWDEVFRKDTTV